MKVGIRNVKESDDPARVNRATLLRGRVTLTDECVKGDEGDAYFSVLMGGWIGGTQENEADEKKGEIQ